MYNRHLPQNGTFAAHATFAVTVLVTGTIGLHVAAAAQRPIAIDAAAEAALSASFGDAFSIERSERFILLSDLTPRRLAELELLGRMDSTYTRILHFCETYALAVTQHARRLEVVCFAQPRAFEALADSVSPRLRTTDGFYDPASKRSYFVNRSAARLSTATGDIPRPSPDAPTSLIDRAWHILVQHETAHQILDHLCPTLSDTAPAWFLEGLACMFETAAGEGIDAYRSINYWRLKDAARAQADPQGGNPVRMIRAGHVWSQPGHAVSSRMYAVAWLIVAYLQDERPEAFRSYLHHLASTPRPATIAVFERFFGPLGVDFNARIAAYLHRAEKRISRETAPFPENTENPVRTP